MEKINSANYGDICLKENLKVILVGIAHYPRLRNSDLFGTVNDVECLYNFLQEKWQVKSENILVLTNAKRDNALCEIRTFCSKLEETDHLLFYYAGHCILGNGRGKSYLTFSDSCIDVDSGKFLFCNVLSINYLNRLFLNCRAKIKVRVFDCCHSGEKVNLLEDYFDKNGVQEGIVNLNKQIQSTEREMLANQKGWVTFYACNLHEEANEGEFDKKDVCRGLFSYYFVKGLELAAATSEEETYYIEDLKTYVSREVLREYKEHGGYWVPQHVQFQCSVGGNIRLN